MAAIQIFKNEMFGEVRVAGTSDEPLFCLSDVCKAVELTNPSSVKSRLDEDEVYVLDLHALNFSDGIGNTKANFITESAFYSVILLSNSPKVKRFKRWVTHEVLPEIRKTGSYSLINKNTNLQPTISDKIKVAKFLSSFLNLNENSKLLIAKSIADPMGLPTPDYTPSKGILSSATDLLKKKGISISAQNFNQKAIEKGVLEDKTRPSSAGKQKHFKSITAKGLAYGENQVNPNNPKSTQPLWYEDKFEELLTLLEIK